MAQQEGNYEILIAKLDEFIRKYYKNRLIRGVIYTIGILVLAFVATAVLEYYGRLNSAWRGILFFGTLALSAYVLTRFIFIPLAKLYRIGDIISYEQASAIIGQHFTDVQDKLLNTLQLKHSTDGAITHSALIEASINQKIAELQPVPFKAAINLKTNYKYVKYALVPVLLFVVILFTNSRIITEGTNRIVNYGTYFEKQAPFNFGIQNKLLQSMQNEDFVLKLKVTGDELPDEVFIEIDGNRFKMEKDDRLSFSYTFKNLQKNLDFRFFASEFYSKENTLKVMAKPLVSGFKAKLEYPAYIGKAAETVENAGDLTLPQGTVVKWDFNTRNAEQLLIRFKDTLLQIQPTGNNRFGFTRRFMAENYYTIKAANREVSSNDSVLYNITIIPDAYPSIKVEETRDSFSTKLVYFAGEAADDYGISRISFNYKFLKSDDAAKTNQPLQSINISSTGAQDRRFYHIWDLGLINLQPAEEIEYYFEVFDNDGINGHKSTKSMVKTFRAPTLKEIEADIAQSSEAIKDKMSEAMEQTKKIDKQIRDLQKKLVEKKSLNWEDKQQIQDLLKKQADLEKQIEDLKLENLEKNIKENEYKKLDSELLNKQKELEKLFDEIFSDEMKEMMKQLEKLMQQDNKEQLKNELENMELNTKDANKQLDRMMELYKKLEVEKKVDEALDKLEELGNKQEKLAEETEKLPDASKDPEKQKELEQKQEDLNKQLDDLKDDLKEVEKLNEELEKPQELGLEEKELDDVEKDMDGSKKDLEKKDNKEAAKKQRDAAKKMKEKKKQAEQQMESAEKEQHVEDYNTLREIMENVIELSFEQERVMEALKQVTGYNPQSVELTQRQRKIKDEAKIVEDSLLALSKRVPQMRTYINREVSEMNANMDKALKALAERQLQLGRNYEQYVMTNMNNLAVMLSEVLKNMQENMNGQSGKGGKDNGARKKKSKDLGKMKKMQEELNQQLKDMKEGKNKGDKGKDGEKDGKNGNKGNKGQNGQGEDGQDGEGGMSSKDWAKMAAQQEALRRYLNDLEKELKEEGNQGALGDLKKTQELMEEVEKDLVNKRLTQETIRRQQEILTRMLDHERAEKERETDKERKSNEGKDLERKLPPNVEEYLKQKNREQELLKTIPPNLREYYKNKTREYFKEIGGN
jgi:hypothetical protein